MLMFSGQPMAARAGGAAQRRRARQLRSFLPHERMTVRMALAEALHHSCGVEPSAPNEALWGLKTASAAGTRPEPLAERSAPQGAVTVGYVAVPGPLLSTPLLVDTAAEAVDARAVKFLLQKTLARKKKEEEEERRKEVAKQREEMLEVDMKLLNSTTGSATTCRSLKPSGRHGVSGWALSPLLRPLGGGGRRRRGGSVDFLVVCGYDAVGKGSTLALRCLVRSVPFFCRQA